MRARLTKRSHTVGKFRFYHRADDFGLLFDEYYLPEWLIGG